MPPTRQETNATNYDSRGVLRPSKGVGKSIESRLRVPKAGPDFVLRASRDVYCFFFGGGGEVWERFLEGLGEVFWSKKTYCKGLTADAADLLDLIYGFWESS